MSLRKIHYQVDNLADLSRVATELLALAGHIPVWCFEGGIGAGKTALIKELCGYLGVTELVTSPTFSIVNEYRSKDDLPIYHFDFYRLSGMKEVVDMGFESYLEKEGAYLFVEWPKTVVPLLPSGYVEVSIEVLSLEKRRIKVNINGTLEL